MMKVLTLRRSTSIYVRISIDVHQNTFGMTRRLLWKCPGQVWKRNKILFWIGFLSSVEASLFLVLTGLAFSQVLTGGFKTRLFPEVCISRPAAASPVAFGTIVFFRGSIELSHHEAIMKPSCHEQVAVVPFLSPCHLRKAATPNGPLKFEAQQSQSGAGSGEDLSMATGHAASFRRDFKFLAWFHPPKKRKKACREDFCEDNFAIILAHYVGCAWVSLGPLMLSWISQVQQTGAALAYASETLRADKVGWINGMWRRASNWSKIPRAPTHEKWINMTWTSCSCQEVVLIAVNRHGAALEHASPDLQSDREVAGCPEGQSRFSWSKHLALSSQDIYFDRWFKTITRLFKI